MGCEHDAAAGVRHGAARSPSRHNTCKAESVASHHVNDKIRETIMNKGIALALLAVGIGLIVFGINASESFGSEMKRFFTGTPTDKSMWLLLSGIASVVVGTIYGLRPSSRV
jgi:hypothetical protein